MTSKEAEEIKAQIERLERERKQRAETIKAWAIGIAIALLLIFLYIKGSHDNPGMQDTGDSPTCYEYGC